MSVSVRNALGIVVAAGLIGASACTSNGSGHTASSTVPAAGATGSTSVSAPSITPSTTPVPQLTGRIVFGRVVPVDGDFPRPPVIMNADGTDLHRLPGHWESPVWSPDGTELVVSSDGPPGGPRVVRPDGTSVRLVQPQNAIFSGCIWTPDASHFLCDALGQGKRDGLYMVRASDGGGLVRLTHSPYHDTVGSASECVGGDEPGGFSPDGTRFVFLRKRCGALPDPNADEDGTLYVENVDGTELRRITDYGVADVHDLQRVSWSPDGTEILFFGDCMLHLVHPDGTDLTTIPEPGCAFSPAWSPDGNWIVFDLNNDATATGPDLFVTHPDGTDLIQLTHTPNIKEVVPNWGP